VAGGTVAFSFLMFDFRSSTVQGLFLYTLPFSISHTIKSGGDMYGDWSGQSHFEIILFSEKLVFSSKPS
jgi:hypothetical protein